MIRYNYTTDCKILNNIEKMNLMWRREQSQVSSKKQNWEKIYKNTQQKALMLICCIFRIKKEKKNVEGWESRVCRCRKSMLWCFCFFCFTFFFIIFLFKKRKNITKIIRSKKIYIYQRSITQHKQPIAKETKHWVRCWELTKHRNTSKWG